MGDIGNKELIASPRTWGPGCSIALVQKDDEYLVCVKIVGAQAGGGEDSTYAPLSTFNDPKTFTLAPDAWAVFAEKYDLKPSADAGETKVPITVSKTDKPAAWVLTVLKSGSKLHESQGFIAGVASPTRSADIEAAKKKKEAETIMSNAAAEKKNRRVQEILESYDHRYDMKHAKALALKQYKCEQVESAKGKSKMKVSQLESMLEAANAEIAELRAQVKKQRVEE